MYPTQREYLRAKRIKRTKRDVMITIIALIVGLLIGLLI
jgi:hypothetical protein